MLVGVPKAGFDYNTSDFLLVTKRTAKMCHTVRCGILTLKRNFKLFDALSAMFPINCHHFESFKVSSFKFIYYI